MRRTWLRNGSELGIVVGALCVLGVQDAHTTLVGALAGIGGGWLGGRLGAALIWPWRWQRSLRKIGAEMEGAQR